MTPEQQELLTHASAARKHAYAPYSEFRVGAALRTRSGKIYCGVNIENASYPMTNCAERSALFAAVSNGERKFVALAICGGRGDNIETPCFPCGACRQVLAEFCDADFPIILSNGVYTLGTLLPNGFRL